VHKGDYKLSEKLQKAGEKSNGFFYKKNANLYCTKIIKRLKKKKTLSGEVIC
jgi:hypothetical protein